MKKKYLFLVLFVMVSLGFYAQEIAITGTVTDGQNEPLAGVSVVVKGTTKGTATDFDGNYQIEANRGESLVFSYIGFAARTLLVSDEIINVTLQESAQALEDVVVIGSRNVNRTATDSPVPVDVIDVAALTSASPQVTINEILNYAAPSFSSNAQTITDGTDHIDPASLRGLGPDQVLVLINGKRRHKTSLVNINGSFGRGNVGTDMNAIPSNAIQRLEILRDGAAAQYGSDAIAGVINIVLKKSVNELNVSLYTGANLTSEIGPDKTIDGEKVKLDLNYGLPIGEDGGYINLSGTFGFRGYTNRMKEWEGSIFNAYNAIERVANNDGYDISLLLDDDITDVQNYASAVDYFDAAYVASIEGALDKETLQGILVDNYTEEELAARGLQRSDFNMRIGQSKLRDAQLFANMSIPVGEKLELYGFGGIGFRQGNSAGFYRLPNQERSYTPVYLNGFLPEINSTINDQSLALGLRGIVNGWNIDFSNTWGKNIFTFRVTNSNNASRGNATPFEANSGGHSYSENTTNFDMSKFFDDIFAGFNVAFGAEYRLENYQIIAGDEVSYSQYNTLQNIHDPTDPESVVPTDFFGRSRPGAIQVFPGFSPDNEVNAFRNSVAGYIDLEADFTERFLVSGAVRYENYSDFGGTINFKLASMVKVSENLNIRGGIQTGFRAPSLHQINFNSTSTLFRDGLPSEVGTFSNTSRVARIIGIDPLKEETSQGYTIGMAAKIPSARIKITLDAYLIDIKDRVILTGQFTDNGDDELAALLAQFNAEEVAFFANSVDTGTKGIDIVIDHSAFFGVSNQLKLTNILSFTISETEVENVKIPRAVANAGLEDTYFDPASRIYLEAAVPTTKGSLSHRFEVGEKWSFFLRNAYFGEVEEATNLTALTNPGLDRIYAGKVVTDLSIGYAIGENMRVTLGANNLLDVYPDISDPAFQSNGRFLYSRRSTQFGFNGRHVFARLSFKL